MKVLTAIYDLANSPVSYDFLKYLAGAAAVKRKTSLDHMHVVFVPADTETGFRIDHKKTSTENKIWRLHNLCVPLCRLYGASYTILPNRQAAAAIGGDYIWPLEWTLENSQPAYWFGKVRRVIEKLGLAPMQIDEQAQQFCEAWGAKPGEYVTITLRQTYHEPYNSNRDAWDDVRDWLQMQGQQVIWVPDTEHAIAPPGLGSAAALNPIIRHALYAGAKMNLGVGGGTQCVCWFSDIPFISFKMLKDGLSATPEFYERWGLPVGTQLPWATDKQRIVWEGSDTFDNITKHYDEVMGERLAA